MTLFQECRFSAVIFGLLLACSDREGSPAPRSTTLETPSPPPENSRQQLLRLPDPRCHQVTVATVDVDAWGWPHHVTGQLVLSACDPQKHLYREAVGTAAKKHFEKLVEEYSFMAIGICLDSPKLSQSAAANYAQLRSEIVGAANGVAGFDLITEVSCADMVSAEYM